MKIIFLRFADYPGESVTVDEANEIVFEAADSVASYYNEVSFGKLAITGSVHGYYTLPHNGEHYCTFQGEQQGVLYWYNPNGYSIRSDALQLIPDSADLASADQVFFVVQGLGTVGLNYGTFNLIGMYPGRELNRDVLIHEMGHGLGLRHAAGVRDCSHANDYQIPFDLSTGCQAGRYSGNYDPMGGGNTFHFSARNKELLGFFEGGNIASEQQSGVHTIYPLEIPAVGPQMIKIPIDDKHFYFLEYRTLRGFDDVSTRDHNTGFPPIDGVLLWLVPRFYADYNQARVQTVLSPGTPFIDPYRGIRVEVIEKDGDSAKVSIQRINRTSPELEIEGNSDIVTFPSIQGAEYTLEGSHDLQTWTPLRMNILGEPEVTSVSHSHPIEESRPRNYFYRVLIEPRVDP